MHIYWRVISCSALRALIYKIVFFSMHVSILLIALYERLHFLHLRQNTAVRDVNAGTDFLLITSRFIASATDTGRRGKSQDMLHRLSACIHQ